MNARDHMTSVVIPSLRAAQQNADTEAAHEDADDALCDFLVALGYADVVAEFQKVKRWYS